MKKKICILILIIFLFGTGIFMYIYFQPKAKSYEGIYYSASNEVTIKIMDGMIYITENQKDYLYQCIYNRMFNENMDKEAFEHFVQRSVANMKQGVEYVERTDLLRFWPVEEDAANFRIELLDNHSISFFNKIYNKKFAKTER